MKNLIRTFIAIELPTNLQEHLGKIIASLQQSSNQFVRWIPSHNIHLTLKFLGDLNIDSINQISELLRRQIPQFTSFTVKITNLGAYPRLDRPRVIWIGMDAPKVLFDLYENLENELSGIGIPKENRPFSPHLTLGRVKRNATFSDIKPLKALIQRGLNDPFLPINLDQVTLFRSDLTPSGAIYNPLLRIKLSSV